MIKLKQITVAPFVDEASWCVYFTFDHKGEELHVQQAFCRNGQAEAEAHAEVLASIFGGRVEIDTYFSPLEENTFAPARI
ncbi:MAG TPA: hypothetical protein VIL74_20565 [Pyrinomonadaceae bacterium]|jgi:hypothetical protein